MEAPAEEQAVEVEAPPAEEAPAAPQSADSPVVVSGAGGALPVGRERLIIKNGEMTLLVEDTDVTIDRLAQVVGDLGGYIISSRVWYQERQGDEYKYATVTLAVPASEFENALRRLRAWLSSSRTSSSTSNRACRTWKPLATVSGSSLTRPGPSKRRSR